MSWRKNRLGFMNIRLKYEIDLGSIMLHRSKYNLPKSEKKGCCLIDNDENWYKNTSRTQT